MKNILYSLFFLVSLNAFSQTDNLTVVAVGEATADKDKMVIQDPYAQNGLTTIQKTLAQEIVKLIRNDFSFYQKKFFLVEAAPNNSQNRPVTNYDYWNSKAIRFLGTLNVEKNAGDSIKLSFVLEDIKSKKQIFNQTKICNIVTARKIGHELSDAAYKEITGKESIFKSKIVFVSDRNSRSHHDVKEVYLMDYDGKNVTQLTSHGGTAISPSMSLDGRYLLYSLISNTDMRRRNNNLYLMDLKTKEAKVISSKDGINSGAIFKPDSKSILLTLTSSGNAEIYEMELETKTLRKITNHFASDVDPSITVDGKLMTFLSDRAGKAMIYTMDPSVEEKNVKRISYVGQFNATPRFSPDGSEIVFASWLDNSFDLFRIGSDGAGLSRLTKDFGSNEDPSFSNDGEFIAFSSQRVISKIKADQNIYIMDRDGGILGAVTANFGNCKTPRWYNF
jgi:TolB protein